MRFESYVICKLNINSYFSLLEISLHFDGLFYHTFLLFHIEYLKAQIIVSEEKNISEHI